MTSVDPAVARFTDASRLRLLLAVGLPGTLAALALLLWVTASLLGRPVASGGASLTLPEAAAIGDRATIEVLLQRGTDPNSTGRVRAGIIDLSGHEMSALEAATASRQPGVLRQLMDAGARITPANYQSIWCAASARFNNGEVLAFLESQGDHRTPIDCPSAR